MKKWNARMEVMPILDTILSVIAPHACLICGTQGKLVCRWCALDAFPEMPSRCYRCSRLTSDFAVCDRCKKQTALRHVWLRTEYSNTAKELLHLYKYERAQAAQSVIANAMSEILPYLSPATIVVPVPTATSRVRQRGYDQAALLARAIAKEHSLLCSNAVAHLTQSRQVGANRSQRLTQLKATFLVTKPKMIKNAHILLIDDVLTTGSTLETMAAVLKQSGAKSIRALIFAQKQ